MWIVVYVSANKENAEKLVKVLDGNEIISKLRRTDREQSCFEVLVPQRELAQAQDLIIENELF